MGYWLQHLSYTGTILKTTRVKFRHLKANTKNNYNFFRRVTAKELKNGYAILKNVIYKKNKKNYWNIERFDLDKEKTIEHINTLKILEDEK